MKKYISFIYDLYIGNYNRNALVFFNAQAMMNSYLIYKKKKEKNL